MKIPQTIEMQVGALNTSEHNPRQITEDDFAELVKSLLLLPKGLYYRPVVVDDRNIALAGNMRLRALKYIHELGFDDLAEILRASYRFRHFDEAKQSALLNYWREWQMHPTVPTLYASELDEDEQQQFIIKATYRSARSILTCWRTSTTSRRSSTMVSTSTYSRNRPSRRWPRQMASTLTILPQELFFVGRYVRRLDLCQQFVGSAAC